jgi:hypothetical protein
MVINGERLDEITVRNGGTIPQRLARKQGSAQRAQNIAVGLLGYLYG